MKNISFEKRPEIKKTSATVLVKKTCDVGEDRIRKSNWILVAASIFLMGLIIWAIHFLRGNQDQNGVTPDLDREIKLGQSSSEPPRQSLKNWGSANTCSSANPFATETRTCVEINREVPEKLISHEHSLLSAFNDLVEKKDGFSALKYTRFIEYCDALKNTKLDNREACMSDKSNQESVFLSVAEPLAQSGDTNAQIALAKWWQARAVEIAAASVNANANANGKATLDDSISEGMNLSYIRGTQFEQPFKNAVDRAKEYYSMASKTNDEAKIDLSYLDATTR